MRIQPTDRHWLNLFRGYVRKYNQLLRIENTPEQQTHEKFYNELIFIIGQLKNAFANLTESKEKARKEFNPDKIPEEFIQGLKRKARKTA